MTENTFENDGTLVTTFVDLNKYDSINRVRKIEDYIPHMDKLAQYQGNLIYFCEIEMVESMWNLRRKYNLLDKTYIQVFDFKTLPLYSKIDEVKRHFSEGRCPIGLNPAGKESPEFMILMWSKLHFLNRASDLNPFNSNHFCWIDIGITYVPTILIEESLPETLSRIKRIMYEKTTKIRMACICETSEGEISNRVEFYRFRQCKLIMGFFIVSGELLSIISALFLEELELCLGTGFPNTEDTVMASVSAEHREIFDLYYGDYEDIFKSYYLCQSRISTLFINLRHCGVWGLYDEMVNCMDEMIEGYDHNKLNISGSEFLEMYHLFQDIDMNEVNDKEKYGRLGTLLDFINNKDIPNDYSSTIINDWSDYLEILNLDNILTTPLKSTLTNPPLKSNQLIYSDETLITAYYDITKITKKSYNRHGGVDKQADFFKEWSKRLLETDHCMYIFCDPDLVDYVSDVRSKCGLTDKTVIYPFDLRESPYFLLKPLITQCFIQSRHGHLVAGDGFRIFHNIVLPFVWTKMKILEMVADENAFSSRNFIWLDFGIFKINNGIHTSKILPALIDGLDDGAIVMPYIFNTVPSEIEDRGKFYRELRWKMIGGLISVPRFLMKKFITAWTDELKLNLLSGYPALEEQILACVKAKEPQLFNCYQGDYEDVIANRFGLQTKFHIIMQNLQHCNALSYHVGIAEIAPNLLDLISPDDNRYSIDQIVTIYNEILIGCWYLEDKRHISRDAANRMKKLLPMSTLPVHTKQNMISNMGFHDIKLD
jgi:Bacterial protein of unknown function (HtrL_YibB)